jgi:hypothetical protein
MKDRLHLGLQIQVGDRLGDPVRDGGHAEHSNSSSAPPRYLNRSDRRRHVAPRGQPIPELVGVPRRFLSNAWIDSSSTPSAPRLALTLRHASQTSRLEIANGLPSGFGSLTGSSRTIAVDQPASQDDQPPSLHPHYRASQLPRGCPPLCPASLLSPSRFQPLGVLAPGDRPRARPLHHWPAAPSGADRFTRSAPEPGPSSRHLHAGHHLANKQAPARLFPGLSVPPGFDVILLAFRHVVSGSLALAFMAHTCRAHGRDFSADAHHHGS